MKKLFASILAINLTVACYAQDYDTIAIRILDHMSDIIGDLSSCRYTVSTAKDVSDFDLGQTTQINTHEVYMMGPDKMVVNSVGDNGHKEYWYNGSVVSYYNFEENNYAIMEAPPTILRTIDTIHQLYGIDFPAADFFYPAFTDDLMSNSTKINYAGISELEKKECFHIIASSKEMNVQFWISNDATMLPEKMIIQYEDPKNKVFRYEATFSEWQLNPDLPDSMFDFLPPSRARKITMLPK